MDTLSEMMANTMSASFREVVFMGTALCGVDKGFPQRGYRQEKYKESAGNPVSIPPLFPALPENVSQSR